jgi:phosphoribosylformylglycinamidine synthase
MGAAGLTCSTCEMGSRGGLGIEIELTKVPQRETGMTPYEIMLSESQERMLLVAERGREQEVLAIFAKWGLDAVEIGVVTGDGMLRVRDAGKVVAEIPAHPLAEEGPVYNRPMRAPAAREKERLVEFVEAARGAASSAPTNEIEVTANFKKLLGSPAVASKRWIFEQYDHMVRTNTRVAPGAGDAAVVRIKGTRRALALSVDCNGRWCWLVPRTGAMHAVAEAARNVACSGARPMAATNCLNFGNPEKPEIMWQFSEVIDGMAEACRALGVPITGGNVSFYNETLGKPIFPTPVIGVLGMMEDESRAVGMGFRQEGDVIVMLDGSGHRTVESGQRDDRVRREFSSSEYAKAVQGVAAGEPPAIDLEAEKQLIEALVALASAGAVKSAHDVSDGGLAVTVAECCFAAGERAQPFDAAQDKQAAPLQSQLSAEVRLEGAGPAEYALFEESGARAVVSCDEASLVRVTEIARQCGVRANAIGRVTAGPDGAGRVVFRIDYAGSTVVAADVAELREVWAGALERAVKGEGAASR